MEAVPATQLLLFVDETFEGKRTRWLFQKFAVLFPSLVPIKATLSFTSIRLKRGVDGSFFVMVRFDSSLSKDRYVDQMLEQGRC